MYVLNVDLRHHIIREFARIQVGRNKTKKKSRRYEFVAPSDPGTLWPYPCKPNRGRGGGEGQGNWGKGGAGGPSPASCGTPRAFALGFPGVETTVNSQ